MFVLTDIDKPTSLKNHDNPDYFPSSVTHKIINGGSCTNPHTDISEVY